MVDDDKPKQKWTEYKECTYGFAERKLSDTEFAVLFIGLRKGAKHKTNIIWDFTHTFKFFKLFELVSLIL